MGGGSEESLGNLKKRKETIGGNRMIMIIDYGERWETMGWKVGESPPPPPHGHLL